MNASRSSSIRQALAGCVPLPAKSPATVTMRLQRQEQPDFYSNQDAQWQLVTEQWLGPELGVKRTFPLEQVAAICVPDQEGRLEFGRWFLREEIGPALWEHEQNTGRAMRGVVFAPEQTPTLMEVEAGMTFAESAEYYPPIATADRDNQYEFAGERRTSAYYNPLDCSSSDSKTTWNNPLDCSSSDSKGNDPLDCVTSPPPKKMRSHNAFDDPAYGD